MNDAEQNGAGPPDLERERLALERERLALERERLEDKEKRLEALEAALAPRDERAVQLGTAALAVAAAACLALGALAGGAIGWDAGRSKAPPPRKVMVSRQFLSLLVRAGGLPARSPEYGEYGSFRGWLPTKRSAFPENAVLFR